MSALGLQHEKKKAVALVYDPKYEAPVIIAKGVHLTAKSILDIASEHGIPIVQNEPLAGLLLETDIGTCIPEQTWQAVASIFAFLEKGITEKWF